MFAGSQGFQCDRKHFTTGVEQYKIDQLQKAQQGIISINYAKCR